MASMAFMATPVWKSTSPISTKNGMGVSEKLAIDATPLRIIWTSPASPPSQTHAPTTLMARNAKAAGRPTARSTDRTPNRTVAASHQTMAGDERAAQACGPLPSRAPAEEPAPHELDGEEGEADRHRRVQPPLREDHRLDHHASPAGPSSAMARAP